MSMIRGRISAPREVNPKRIIFGKLIFYKNKKGEWFNPLTGRKCIKMTMKEFLNNIPECYSL